MSPIVMGIAMRLCDRTCEKDALEVKIGYEIKPLEVPTHLK